MKLNFMLLIVVAAIVIAALVSSVMLLSSPEPENPEQTSFIEPSGGTFTSSDQKVTLEFPSGALSERTEITVKAKTGAVADEGAVPGSIYEFGPDVEFDKPVLLTIKYDTSELPDSALGSLMCIAKFNGTAWNPIFNSSVDETQNTVTAEINSFSDYAAYSFFARLEPDSTECAPGGNTFFFINTNLPRDSYDYTIASNGTIGRVVDTSVECFDAPRQWQITYEVFSSAELGAKETLTFMLDANCHFIVGGAMGSSGGNLSSDKWTEFQTGDPITTMEAEVTVSGFSIVIDQFGRDDLRVKNGSRAFLRCIITGLSAEEKNQLVYVWNCTCYYGHLTGDGIPAYSGSGEQSYEIESNEVTYWANADAEDTLVEEISLMVYKVDGSDKTWLQAPNMQNVVYLEIYNPTTVYNFCGDPLGTTWPKLGSGSQWQFFVGDQGQVSGGFRARIEEEIRIICVDMGAEPYGDLYLRVGFVGEATTKTQLLVSKGEMVEGLDKTVEINIE